MSSRFAVIDSIASPIPTPALLASTSSRPKRSRCEANNAAISSSWVIWVATWWTSSPSAASSRAAASSLSGRRAETVTP